MNESYPVLKANCFTNGDIDHIVLFLQSGYGIVVWIDTGSCNRLFNHMAVGYCDRYDEVDYVSYADQLFLVNRD